MSSLAEIIKKVRDEMIIEREAKEIIDTITEWLSNKTDIAKRSWIFELIQNAVDTARRYKKERLSIEVSLDQEKKRLIFKHDGGPFSPKEIYTLVCGGTSKYSGDGEFIGRFGMGFMTTHILSKKVEIEGIAEDNSKQKYTFKITLDRDADDLRELAKKISNTIEDLKGDQKADDNSELIAKYTYFLEIDDERKYAQRLEAAEYGIDMLKKLGAIVMAFNPEIYKITIEKDNEKEEFERSDQKSQDCKYDNSNGISEFVINHNTSQGQTECRIILIHSEQKFSVAIFVKDKEIQKIENDIPRIFTCMPLIGTETIPVPFIINSPYLKPSRGRDSILLAGEEEYTRKNKEIIHSAFRGYIELLKFCVKNGYKGIPNLCDFSRVPGEYISQQKEYWTFWQETISEMISNDLKNEKIIKVQQDEYEEPANTNFPDPYFSISNDIFNKVYELLGKIGYKLPSKDVLPEWINVISRWREIDKSLSSTIIDLHQIKKRLLEMASIESLEQKKLLLDFFEILENLYKKRMVEKEFIDGLILTQDRILRSGRKLEIRKNQTKSVKHISIDGGINEEIKDIFGNIAYDIRQVLLDRDISKYSIVNDFVDGSTLNVDQIIEELLSQDHKPSSQRVDFSNQKDQAWAKLFVWCIMNSEYVKYIKRGFPIYTKQGVEFLNETEEPIMLLPFDKIGINNEYEDIFPEKRIINPKYFELTNDNNIEDFKIALVREKICYSDILFSTKKLKMKREKLKKILTDRNVELDTGEHEIDAGDGHIFVIPFWNEVIGRISQNPERARKFFDFVLNVLVQRDDSLLKDKKIIVSCSCGKSHEIIPSAWIAYIATDRWIPLQSGDEDGIVQVQPTKDNIEKLLSKEKIHEVLRSSENVGIKLLSILGFDKFALFVEKQTMLGESEQQVREEIAEAMDYITSRGYSLGQIRGFLSKVHNLNDLNRFLDKISQRGMDLKRIEDMLDEEELESTRSTCQDNVTIGKTVERIIFDMLQNKRLNVSTRHEGADIEIWPIEEGLDGGRIIVEPYLIEIKFTTSDRVRLSKKQADLARQQREEQKKQQEGQKKNYILLVVKGDTNLKEELLRYDEISDKQKKKELKNKIINHSYVVENISERLDSLEKSFDESEVKPDIHGYWIKETLWTNERAKKLEKWIEEVVELKSRII